MGFIPAVLSAFARYFDFRTRSSRSEFWYFALFNVLVLVTALSLPLAAPDALQDTYSPDEFRVPISALFELYALGTIIPSIALAIRRLHDISQPGWWLLLVLFLLPGYIVLIVMFSRRGHKDENKWGENPLRDYDADWS